MNKLRLTWQFFRISVLNELQYRTNLFVQVVQSGFALATGLGGIAIVFSHTQTLAGWRPAELLTVLGVYLLIGGMVNMVVHPSVQRLLDDVREGTLDFVLTKPEDAQLLVSVRQVEVWKLADMMVGATVIAVALWQLGANVGVGQAAAFVVALGAGAAVTYSFLLMLATCSFWFVKIQNIILIFGDVYEAGAGPWASIRRGCAPC
jgi:ABC-2 type transport system permease protein